MSELEREGELPTNDIFETKFQRRGLPSTQKPKKRAKTRKKLSYALPSEGLVSSPPNNTLIGLKTRHLFIVVITTASNPPPEVDPIDLITDPPSPIRGATHKPLAR